MTNDFDELKNLSPEEREAVLKVLDQYSKDGKSNIYDNMLYGDYREIPVDIETFITDPKYLGKALANASGKCTVYPYWINVLKDIFPDPFTIKYNTVILTGGIGLGKSTIADIGNAYQLYKLQCLKDPYDYYGLQNIDTISIGFLNNTIENAKDVAWKKFHNMLVTSDWFVKNGCVNKLKKEIEWEPPDGLQLIAGSSANHLIGKCVFGCFIDEINFNAVSTDIEKQKKKALELVTSVSNRMQSRFMKGTKNPTVLFIASSKDDEQAFLETFIETKKKNESTTTLIIDEPQWVIRTDKDSPVKFKVALGNKLLPNELVPLNATEDVLNAYRNKGYSFLDVPIGYYESFKDNLEKSLRDIAGKSTTGITRYISGERILKIKSNAIKNCFIRDVIEVGNASDDTSQYYDFFDLSRVDKSMMHRPMYIHLDMSVSGDKTGIAGVWIRGKKPHKDGIPDSKELYYQAAFSVSVKAPNGYQISFEKTRQFIYWLKEQGFNIKGISSDTYQNADLAQQLSSKGYNYKIISVDRVNSESRVCEPYHYFKNTMYEERLLLYNECNLLTDELIGLERKSDGHIDHSPAGINCFTGDTKIQLLDGSSKTILELLNDYNNGITNYVYTFNHELEKIEPKKINKVFKSGSNAKLVEVTLDNGEIIKCTPEHKFMTRLGEYIEAKDLLPYDSLMPLYTKYPSAGLCKYRLYYEPMEDAWHYEHRRFAEDIFDEKYLVHHKDCNPKNNRPDNLIWMSKSAHMSEHSRLQTGAQSHEAKRKRSEGVKLSHKNVNNTKNGVLRYYKGTLEERRLKKQKHDEAKVLKEQFYNELSKLFNTSFLELDSETRRRCLAIYKNYKAGNNVSFDLNNLTTKELKNIEKQNQLKVCEYYNVDINSLSRYELYGLIIKYYYETIPGYKEHIRDEISKNHKAGKYIKAKEALADRVWWANGKPGKENNLYIKNTEIPPEGFWRGRVLKNHKVVSVKFVDYVDDVYDIEVQDNHNFALAAGVFVHNSKDQSDAMCGAIYNASFHADEFALEFGEFFEDAINANDEQQYDVKQVQVDFENEMKLAFDNLHKNKDNDHFQDFGMGKAQDFVYCDIGSGIFI